METQKQQRPAKDNSNRKAEKWKQTEEAQKTTEHLQDKTAKIEQGKQSSTKTSEKRKKKYGLGT